MIQERVLGKERELDELVDKVEAAIIQRDQEIERLRAREKYLSEGRTRPLGEAAGSPALDDFL